MRVRFAITALLFLATAVQALAMTRAELIDDYRTCLKFLALSPEKQADVCRRGHRDPARILSICEDLTSVRLSELLQALYERQHPGHGGGGGGGYYSPSHEEPTPTPTPTSGLSASGTCYDLPNCNGRSEHVNLKVNCPAGFDSFQADYGGYGCESLH